MLKAIVFDFDGVIVDSEPLHYRAFLDVARDFGVTFTYEEYLADYIGFDDRDGFRELLTRGGQKWDEALIARLVAKKADIFESIVRKGIETYPGVRAFIEHAAATLPIAIASGATRRDIDLILAGTGLAGRFKLIVSADDVAKSKPDPESYAKAARGLAGVHPALNLQPGDCLAIEDTAAGIESARGAGLMTLGVTTTGDAATLRRAMRVVPALRGLTVDRLREWYG